jgi:hypothetical protein
MSARTEYCSHGELQRRKLGTETGSDGVVTCLGCHLPVWRAPEQVGVPVPAGRPAPMTRQEAALAWFSLFGVLTVLGALVAFLAAGYIRGTHDAVGDEHFNLGAGFAAAAALVVVWLPVIAIFDYLRRPQP